jgi:hypothetical protein
MSLKRKTKNNPLFIFSSEDMLDFDKQSLSWNVLYKMATHEFKHRTDVELEQEAEFNPRGCK